MNILILSRYQGSVNRGVESVVMELSKRLSKKHNVDVLSGKESDSFSNMVSGNYDVVMPVNGRLQSLKASIGRLFKRYKLVIGGHSGIGKDDIWNIVISRPDVFIALTNHMKDWARGWGWGVKVIKIPDGVDIEKFKPDGARLKIDLESPVVLSVGALSWYKHHEKTIDAVSLLSNASLLIVGSGEKERDLEKQGREKLGDRFKIINVDYKKMSEIYRACDVFTLPSWDREAFGVVYLEAMASGLPVVAPNDPPRKEIIGKSGILTNVDNPQVFALAIQEALDRRWGDIPRKQAEKFDWEKVVKEYEECFLSL